MSIGAVIVEEFDELHTRERKFSIQAFVKWLIDVDEVEGLTARDLDSLHYEFCLLHDVQPISRHKQAMLRSKVGIRKSRPRSCGRSGGKRLHVYHIDPKIVAARRKNCSARAEHMREAA